MKGFSIVLSVVSLFVGVSYADTKAKLFPGGFFVPGIVKFPDIKTSRSNLRFSSEFIVYVTEPGKVSVTMRRPLRLKGTVEFSVLSPENLELGHAKVVTGKSGAVTFYAKKVGLFKLLVKAVRLDFTLDAEGGKLLIPATVDTPFHGFDHAAPLFFFVPSDAKQFKMTLCGQGEDETAKARVLGPNGTVIARLNASRGKIESREITVPDGMDDCVWAVVIGKGDNGRFEDFEFTLFGDVSPYVSQRPEDVLCPALKVTSSRLVSGDMRDPLPHLDINWLAGKSIQSYSTIEFTVKRESDNATVFSKKILGARVEKEKFRLTKRPQAGKYKWSIVLRQNGKAIADFDGVWYFTPAPKYITQDRIPIVDGKPFFARGLYHVESSDYNLVRKQGFNAVQCHANDVAAVAAAGLKAGVALYWGPKRNRDIRTAPGTVRWRAKIDKLIDSKSIFAWWLQDEPGGQFDSRDSLAEAYAYLRRRDPGRPAYLSLCKPTKFEYFAPQTDIVALDIYPLPDKPITIIANRMMYAKKVVSGNILFYIGQADNDAISAKQYRCMTYLAIVHGAKGLFWYALRDPHWYIPKNAPKLWAAMKKVNEELIVLEPALLKENFSGRVLGKSPESIHLCVKRVDDTFYVIAVNPNGKSVDLSIDLKSLVPKIVFKNSLDALFEVRRHSQKHGMLSEKIEPFGVRIYKMSVE